MKKLDSPDVAVIMTSLLKSWNIQTPPGRSGLGCNVAECVRHYTVNLAWL